MAQPQFPLFDAIGRTEVGPHRDRTMLVRLSAYLVQVAAIGACIWLSSTDWVVDERRWMLLGGCGAAAVASGFVLVWPVARSLADAVNDRLAEARMAAQAAATPPAPEVLPHPRAPHLRLVWDRARDQGTRSVSSRGTILNLPNE
ncbi:MAG: hypothetical protein ABMA64_35290 [Myxococcota bacterium]